MATVKVDKDGIGKGTSGGDRIYGDSSVNFLDGLRGNDSLWGRGGQDAIYGGYGNDKIYGESGSDVLGGGRGRDTLTGGSGKDFFVFESKVSKSEIDTITDFSTKDDTIALDKSYFKGISNVGDYLKSGAFWTGSKAHDRDDRIIYNKSTGALYYDPDGSGSKAAIQFAKLDKGLKMTHKDFFAI
ncbi:M10 family metallopeptidase C-terminal domain-containing protein [Microvirga roseola]|uniref:M10 family metallopeptidase C-terminal domain-containing protein n=1 Tax=Microvirga roseola TaxID=2883126 RepID=UPI0022A85C05|nr:calcium-binding protein [Microvirga roseola]